MADDVEKIARGLTKAQRERLHSFSIEPRQMGIGLPQFIPDLVTPDGMNHPIFGPHYRLTDIGLAVRSYLKDHEHG